MNDLPQEVLVNILLKVEYAYLVKNCIFVNHSWNRIIKHKDFIIHYCKDATECYPRNTSRNTEEIEFCTAYASKMRDMRIPIRALSASSTDDSSQHIAFTITDHVDVFWSSKGTTSEADNEQLIYDIAFEVSIIKFIRISFFKAGWLSHVDGNPPCFTSKLLRIDILNDLEVLVYSSPTFSVAHTSDSQQFNLPKPVFIAKGYKIHLHLIGKTERQLEDNLFYTCVSNFSLGGFVAPNFISDGNNFGKFSDQHFRVIVNKIKAAKMFLLRLSQRIILDRNFANTPQVQFYLDKLSKLEFRLERGISEQ